MYKYIDDVVREQDWCDFIPRLLSMDVKDLSLTAFNVGYHGSMYVREFDAVYPEALEDMIYGIVAGGHSHLFTTFFSMLKSRRKMSPGSIDTEKIIAIAIGSGCYDIYEQVCSYQHCLDR